MVGRFPQLNAESLGKLRQIVSAMQADNGQGVPMSHIVALRRDLKLETGVTIDFGATAEIGSPMVVLRVPTSAPVSTTLENLTKRENEVAHLVATGLSNAEIADRLNISVATVKDHVHNILGKTGLSSRTRIAAVLNGHAVTPAR